MNVTRIIPVLGVIDALMGLDDACFTLPTFRTLRIEERAKWHFALQSPRLHGMGHTHDPPHRGG